ncbi:MAG: methyltransferase [Bacillales bacterium]|jgi:putative N6-adenine-specific DNA methylase|nr:methyltransferase [Bacillales bacterium]
MNKYNIIATSAMGIEAIVAKEVRELGYTDCIVENGKVTFDGDELAIARANLWLRTADRIKIKIGEFKATSFEELFENTKALPWGDLLPANAEFPVSGKSVKSKLYSVPDCQAIVKKAIVSSLSSYYKINGWLQEDGPTYKIEISILKDIATLSIDTSGIGLHKRGYRTDQGEAPLKETLAAALVLLTNWKPDSPFIDPMCGSGTIPIEAALIGQNIAPGFNRDFISEKWPIISSDIWEKAREEAENLANYDQELDILGSDLDARMIKISNDNAFEAGLGDLINFKQMKVSDLYTKKDFGTLVTNPPYGERLSDKDQVEKLYKELGIILERDSFSSWSKYILTSHEGFETLYGKPATKKRKLFNGFIKTDYYQYFGPRKPKI